MTRPTPTAELLLDLMFQALDAAERDESALEPDAFILGYLLGELEGWEIEIGDFLERLERLRERSLQ